ncbi:hypothetical protein AHAS_Ahas11G0038500 [Arachis hypogaea]
MTTRYWLSPDLVSLVDILPVFTFVGFLLGVGWWMMFFVENVIVDMYTKCGKMDQVNRIFERTKLKDIVSWNIMVTGYF